MNQASTHRLEHLLTRILITADDFADDNAIDYAVNIRLAQEFFPSYTARSVAHDLLEDAVYAYRDLHDKATQRGYIGPDVPSGALVTDAILQVTEDPLSPIPNLDCRAVQRRLHRSFR